MNVNWKVLADQVEAKLNQMKLGGPEHTKALGAIGTVLSNRIRLCFRLGTSPYGAAWEPINPIFRVGQPLRDTGRLQRSINSQVQGGAAVVGTNVRYAATHQFGATIFPKSGKYLAVPTAAGGLMFLKQARIPARPFMPLIGGAVSLPPAWARSALQALAKSMGL